MPELRHRHALFVCFAALALLVAACDDSDEDPDPSLTDTAMADGMDGTVGDVADGMDTVEPPPEPDEVFRFGLAADQPISQAPFPNDIYLAADGTIDVAPLDQDPGLADAAKPEFLQSWTEVIDTRTGFGFTTAVRLFANAEPDLASFEGRVHLLTLTGPEAGRALDVEVFWNEPTSSLGVFPAWGHWMMPGSTFAVLVESGVTMADGTPIEAPASFADVLADAEPAGASAELVAARDAWAPLRDHFATVDDSPDSYVIGTVFTTEETLPFGQELFAALDEYPLAAPTRDVRYDAESSSWVQASDVEGADLETFFGTPQPPFENNPATWNEGLRDNAALLGGGARYQGGTLHTDIGRVVHGTLRMPALNFVADGEGGVTNAPLQRDADGFAWSVETAVPFTLYLCQDHLADPSNLPVAIFDHGGTGQRHDGIGFANLNCTTNGVATIALDKPFHGGRVEFTYLPGDNLVVPTGPDEYNTFTDRSAGDADFVPDALGDRADATLTVGQLFGLASNLDPQIIEANLLTNSIESYVLVRYLRDGADWSGIDPNLSFDATNIFHQSLSFGSSFTVALAALTDDLRAVMNSVGSGYMVSANLPMAPNNAALASGIIRTVLGIPTVGDELQAGAYRDFAFSMIQWLSQRGDALAWAPYVLRHRATDHELPVLSNGDSWDETLYTPAQLTYNAAWGFEVFEGGADWTLDAAVPGADGVSATPWTDAVAGNLAFEGRTHTGALFYAARSCHAQFITPICSNGFAAAPAPVPALDEEVVFESPICALHGQLDVFMGSLLAGDPHGSVVAPTGDCAALYAP